MNDVKSVLDRRPGKIVLADGTRFDGYVSGGGRLPVWGEVVFNTAMTGYQEVITDPSYAGQIVVMTNPHIGNYGVHPDDSERSGCAARALIVRELSTFFSPGRGRISLEFFMEQTGLPGLTGVDTRALTRRIRSEGAVIAAVGEATESDESLALLARDRFFSRGESLVEGVSGGVEGNSAIPGGPSVAVIDLGIKNSILQQVRDLGVSTTVFDSRFSAAEVLAGGYDFVVLSNGPGDPEDIPNVVEQTKQLLGEIPILGICLGHQVTALAMGGSTYKLKFGHHGANQSVVFCGDGRVFVTSQNHGYAVADDIAGRPGVTVTYTNANDGTVEGFASDSQMVECLQFHPEASPGPHDTAHLFDEFFQKVKGWRHAATV
jgi:carbamoyl-phosphate synthase small subunit